MRFTIGRWRIEIAQHGDATKSPLERLLSGRAVFEFGFGYRCPFCLIAQDEGQKTGVYWNSRPVCGSCAPIVREFRRGSKPVTE